MKEVIRFEEMVKAKNWNCAGDRAHEKPWTVG
jgi:hypothetical protein